MSTSQRPSFFTVANLLSLARVPLGFLFSLALVAPWGGPVVATAMLVLAGITDVLDGLFARRAEARRTGGLARETPAGTGSWLDPICDKLFVTTVLVAIWFASHPSLSVLALILARELAQVPLSLIYIGIPALRRWLRYDFRASVFGKAATVLQFAAILALLWKSPAAPLMAVVSFVVGLVALGDYLRRAIRLGRVRSSANFQDDLTT